MILVATNRPFKGGNVTMRNAGFFIESQNQGRLFSSGLSSKPLGRFVSGLTSKSLGWFVSDWSQN
jgi:hypothetical protein